MSTVSVIPQLDTHEAHEQALAIVADARQQAERQMFAVEVAAALYELGYLVLCVEEGTVIVAARWWVRDFAEHINPITTRGREAVEQVAEALDGVLYAIEAVDVAGQGRVRITVK